MSSPGAVALRHYGRPSRYVASIASGLRGPVSQPDVTRVVRELANARFTSGLVRAGEVASAGGTMAAVGKLGLAVKRGIDVLGAALGLVVLSPVLAGVAVAVALAHGRPILFRQTRPGRGGRPFTIYKFRTMRPTRPGEIAHLTDPQRVTRLGRFLRETSLDELPELWNVVRGDMSLVGPRPLLMEYLDEYTPEEARRHEVRPGITGWAAVNGRHKIRFRDRLALDTWYVDHWSPWLDLRILAMTLHQVVRRADVSTTESIELGFPLAVPGRPSDGATPTGGSGEGLAPDAGRTAGRP